MKKIYSLLIALTICGISFSQNTLKGKVYDENGKPLSGAFIFEQGTMNATRSSADGSYSINYKDTASVITFSYVGYLKNQILAEHRTAYDAAMILANTLGTAEIVGTRRLGRSQTETAVGVDIIDVAKLSSVSGQTEVNQLLQETAPSFNSNKQSGADGADHIDPATLRGLGPDQTLVLVNGKRRHQSSLINLFGSRGRGNTGTDLNAIPLSAIDHIEILRDGASAQYGSDAIAGVVNVVLKSNTGEMTGSVLTGMNKATPPSMFKVVKPERKFDGETWQFSANNGVKIGKDGFINLTMDASSKKHTFRPSDTSASQYGAGGIYRRKFGDASSNNASLFMNSSVSAGENTEVYAFGGYNYRFTEAYAWSRDSLSERNVKSLYPAGMDPVIQSVITDKSMSMGVRSKLHNGWNMDVNNTFGANNFHFSVDKTANATLGYNSPTHFNAGGFNLSENTSSLNFSKFYPEVLSGLNVAFGSEFRIDNYKIFAGEEGSYKSYGKVLNRVDSIFNPDGTFNSVDSVFAPGGSQGFPGFRPANEVNVSRTNKALYADGELDITENLLVGTALRLEDYSDFGTTTNGKISARYKISNYISARASYGTGFRAPSLAQLYYNTTFTDFVAGQPIDKIIAANNSPITYALGIPELKPEQSANVSYGFTIHRKSFSFTVDAYSVNIKDRIVLTGAFYDSDPVIGNDLKALGVGAAQFFTNAVNTKTHGVDIVLAHTPIITDKKTLRVSVAANFNNMKIDRIYTNDKLKGKENTYFGLREQYFLLASAPKSKITFNANYEVNKFFVDARVNVFGKVQLVNWNDNGDSIADPGEVDVYKSKATLDLALGYNFNNIRITFGAINILNTYPDAHDPALTESGGIWDAVQMGFAGAYYYTKVGFKF
ncbi:MAG: TonB-dependent receptor [Bacteroidetes bacterium]|nr:TonB-dependent receptor [Bacteroidota bacterium]